MALSSDSRPPVWKSALAGAPDDGMAVAYELGDTAVLREVLAYANHELPSDGGRQNLSIGNWRISTPF